LSNPFHGLDLREDILEHLFYSLGTVGASSCWRNRRDLPENPPPGKNGKVGPSLRPAIILLDGDVRSAVGSGTVASYKTVKMPSVPAIMSPEIFVILDVAGDRANTVDKNGAPYDVGQELSFWHWTIKTLIENDDGLEALLTKNGQIVWKAFETDMKSGSTIGAIGPHGKISYDFYFPLYSPRS